MVKNKKLLRTIAALFVMALLVCSLATTSMAATSVEWVTNAGHESLVNVVSNTEFSLVGPANGQTELFSYDPATTNVNTNISTTDISFKVQVDTTADTHSDFYGLFVIRMADPSSGIWGPANAGVSFQIYRDKVELYRWSRAAIDTEKIQALELDIVDGQPHDVSIHVEEYTVTVTVDGQSMTAEYNFIPSSGGYQFMAYNATVHISEFDDGTTPSAPPATEPSEQPTEPEKPTDPKPTESEPTEPAQPTTPEKPEPTEPADTTDDDNNTTTYIIIAAAVVCLCVIVAIVYFVVSRKKK